MIINLKKHIALALLLLAPALALTVDASIALGIGFEPPSKASTEPPLADSLLTEDAVYRYTFSNFPLACRIMDRLRRDALLPTHRLDITQGDLYFNNGYYHRALKHYTAALSADSVAHNDHAYMEQLHRLISTYDCLHNDARKTHYIRLLLHRAQAANDTAMHSIALFNLGKTIYYQNDKPKAYRYMHQAVELMERADYKQKYDNLRYNYNTLFLMQQMDHRYTEALATLEALEAVIDKDGSGQAQMDGLDTKERKALEANRAVVLQHLHRTAEAEACYHRFLALGPMHDRDNYLIVPYLYARGRYDEIIRINTAREQFLRQQKDTITYHISTIKRSLGEAYQRQGLHRQAATYYRQLATVVDSLKRREQRSAVLELATLYDTAEKEALLQQQASQLRERNILLLTAAGIALLLGVGMVLAIRHARIIRRKNRAMVHSIGKQMDYKEKLERARKELQALKEVGNMLIGNVDPMAIVEESLKPIAPTGAANLTKEQEEVARKIFDGMEQELMDRKLYLNRDFGRDHLMRLAGVGKNRIGQIVYLSTGMNANSYINNLRLEHAVQMMKQHPLYTIESIAAESGLPNTSTFYRLFRERFSITPTQYRKGLERMAAAEKEEGEE